ncbi:MAG TPA: IS21 family transposase [Kofleriaceae bacterium]
MQRRSHREVARALGVGSGSPGQALARASRASITCWSEVEALSDEELDARMYPTPTVNGELRPEPNPAAMHIELRRPGVTLRLLHEEYLVANPNAYGYTKFVEVYNAWADRLHVTMRQVHKAGEKCFVDYSGKKPSIVDANTGKRIEVELFVAVMGASNYTFVEATMTQRSADWIASHVRLVEFLGGAPHALVPDQLKSGVVIASRYEPGIQRTYEEWSQHYSTTILPARPMKPRDKAKVEGGVLIAQRWILARLRNVTCFSLDELNEHIAALVADLNGRVMKRYGKSRRELFDELDRPAITGLPTDRFIHGDWSKAQVKLDYHVHVDHHDYSVPYQRATDDVEIRVSAATVEIFYKNKRCASHVRSFEHGGVTTNLEHLPASHRAYAEESDAGFETWAGTIGPHTLALVRAILVERPHPEHGLRSCRGLKSLTRVYGLDRIEAACERALVAGARSYLNVESILKCGLDQQPLTVAAQSDAEPPSLEHENIRGADYYN